MTHTSTKQPEALRLAGLLRIESDSEVGVVKYSTAKKAEQELRRLHACVQELKAERTARMTQNDRMAERIAELEAQVQHAAPVPQGWKLVPDEPTKEMIAQACKDHGYPSGSRWVYRDGYRAMLAAAPQPPEAAPVQLPEPVAVMTDTTPREPGWKTMFVPDSGTRLYTEHQVRELLAAHGIQEQST